MILDHTLFRFNLEGWATGVANGLENRPAVAIRSEFDSLPFLQNYFCAFSSAVEQGTHNSEVIGSNPVRRTNLMESKISLRGRYSWQLNKRTLPYLILLTVILWPIGGLVDGT